MMDVSYSIRKLLFDTSYKDILNFLPVDLSLIYICTFVIHKFSVTHFQGSFRSENSHYGCVDILAAMVA